MRSWRTTLAGVVAGLSMLCAVALALLGYHAVDCTTCPGNKLRRVAAGLALMVCMLLVGCAVSSLSLGVSSPAFGSVKLSIGGGAIGNKAPTLPPEPTNAAPVTVGTNQPPVAGG
jgi:hypothetical protein